MKIESILRTTVRVQTHLGARHLTNATGFFFRREARLFLVTCGHVVHDPASGHRPDRLEIDLRIGDDEVSVPTRFSIPLFENGMGLWRTVSDSAGAIDVAAIELAPTLLPKAALYRAFTPEHLVRQMDSIEVGQPILVVGYPLGFQDNLHQLPIVRQAVIASSFGLRFQGQGYFLTDARTHRGTSGAPVVLRRAGERSATDGLPWLLLGVHSARLDVGTRDLMQDEALGLNCAWYTDALMALTATRPA